jgi:lipoyl(octanoyl) transferase
VQTQILPGSVPWYWVDSGPGEPAFNMALDEALLEAMPRLGRPALRFYGWTEPAATFGYFQHYGEVAALTPLRPLVRRPTGGGIVPHDADWTYSLAFPTHHEWYGLVATESYRRVHAWIQAAFARLGTATDLAPRAAKAGPGQCFVGYEQSDVLWQGRKIAGAAQRRRRDGLLIQGSVQPPPALKSSRDVWQQALCERVPAGQAMAPWRPDAELLVRARDLAGQKYSRADFNQRR